MSTTTTKTPMDDWDDDFLRVTCEVLRCLRKGPAGFRADPWRRTIQYLEARGMVEVYDDGAVLHVRRRAHQ